MARIEAAMGSATWFVVGTATGGTASATKAASAKNRHYLTGLSISMSAAPAAAVTATLSDGATVIDQFEIPATAQAPMVVNFPRAYQCSPNAAVTLSVPSLGGGVKCSVAIRGFTLAA